MSTKIVEAVFQRYQPATRTEYLLALFLATEADDEGGGIWPTVEMMSHAVRASERMTQYALARMKQTGWLEAMGCSKAGMGKRYRISPEWLADTSD